MAVNTNGYLPGGALGFCQRCGFRRRLTDLKREWTGLLVCPEDYDPRPVTLDPPLVYPEGLVSPNASPEPTPRYVTTPITPQDLS